jgi:hypothetical protein
MRNNEEASTMKTENTDGRDGLPPPGLPEAPAEAGDGATAAAGADAADPDRIADLPVDGLRPHPLLGRIPPMGVAEKEAFDRDVLDHGVQEPVTVQRGGTLLDGRERLDAQRKAGRATVRARVVDLTPDEQERFIYRASLRRNLTDDQRAILMAEYQQALARRAQQEQARKAGGRGRAKAEDSSEAAPASKLCEGDAGHGAERSRTTAAKAGNVSESKMKKATALLKANSKLADQVLAGSLTLAKAEQQAAQERKEKATLPAAGEGAPAPGGGRPPTGWRVLEGDSLEVMPGLPAGAARLIFAEPPATPADTAGFGPGGFGAGWWERWLRQAHRRLRANGSLWLLLDDDGAAARALPLHGPGVGPAAARAGGGGGGVLLQAARRPPPRPGRAAGRRGAQGVPAPCPAVADTGV